MTHRVLDSKQDLGEHRLNGRLGRGRPIQLRGWSSWGKVSIWSSARMPAVLGRRRGEQVGHGGCAGLKCQVLCVCRRRVRRMGSRIESLCLSGNNCRPRDFISKQIASSALLPSLPTSHRVSASHVLALSASQSHTQPDRFP